MDKFTFYHELLLVFNHLSLIRRVNFCHIVDWVLRRILYLMEFVMKCPKTQEITVMSPFSRYEVFENQKHHHFWISLENIIHSKFTVNSNL